ncbi:uncharacterized protein PADG_06240 [Paracoccidioides brasiliensis Pb18]|uniref:Uncharacterized protein n=2 Tax=Paracoccidioides brasiliensis TaxID=121759 RepID=C1GG03_PARBD|nr:uncharacterized protein PADG_06240 [Paracoccidioides brasiliensis Pb18]EEH50161.2 hypothetical protein PADG_06240 [Paracoccidioides brasiliensis Pb18]ODH13434.1 hypothetical protein ACO22_07255 [Paracoccidioides brasiliensis]
MDIDVEDQPRTLLGCMDRGLEKNMMGTIPAPEDRTWLITLNIEPLVRQTKWAAARTHGRRGRLD